MIRFLSVNDPYRLLLVLMVMVALGWFAHSRLPDATIPEIRGMVTGEMVDQGKLLYVRNIDSTPPLTAMINWGLVKIAGRSLEIRHAVTIAVLFLQAVIFALLIIRNRAFEQQTFLPPFLYAVLLFFSLDTIAFTREVWASFFLMLAIDRVFRQLQFREQLDPNLHVLGVFVGLSSLCSFSYSIFFPGILAILAVTTRLGIREVFLFTTGFLLPHFCIAAGYAFIGRFPELWANFYAINLEFNTRSFMDTESLLWLSLLPATYLFFALLLSIRNTRFTRYQAQIFNVMLIWLFFGIIEIWLTRQRTAQSLLVCLPPMAYFITNYLMRIHRKWLAETMLWALFGALISISTFAMEGKIKSISYSGNFAGNDDPTLQGKKLLVLGPDLAVYRNNRVASFFPEWAISEEIFRKPGYYENVVLIYDSFQVDPPDVIIDPENLMPEVFKYMPQVASDYRKTGDRYIRTITGD